MLKDRYRPLRRHRIVSGVAFFLLFSAFLLFLLVGISLPIIKPIYLLVLQSTTSVAETATSVATKLTFGVWGVCATGTLNEPNLLTNDELCIGPQLGYTVPPSIASLVNVSQGVVDAVQRALLIILVLHPIAAGISFVTFISALFLASHGMAIFTLILAIIIGLLGAVVLAIDVALVVVVRNEVATLNEFKFAVDFGNGVWMVLVGVVATWVAVIFLSARVCYCCGVRRHERDHRHRHRHDKY